MKKTLKFYDGVPVGSNLFEDYLTNMSQEVHASLELAFYGSNSAGGYIEGNRILYKVFQNFVFLSAEDQGTAKLGMRLEDGYSVFNVQYIPSVGSVISDTKDIVKNVAVNYWETPVIALFSNLLGSANNSEVIKVDSNGITLKIGTDFTQDYLPYKPVRVNTLPNSMGSVGFGFNAVTFNGVLQPKVDNVAQSIGYNAGFVDESGALSEFSLKSLYGGAESPKPLNKKGQFVPSLVFDITDLNATQGFTIKDLIDRLGAVTNTSGNDTRVTFDLEYRFSNFTAQTHIILAYKDSSGNPKYYVIQEDTTPIDTIEEEDLSFSIRNNTFKVIDKNQGLVRFSFTYSFLKNLLQVPSDTDTFFINNRKFNLIAPEVLKEEISDGVVNYRTNGLYNGNYQSTALARIILDQNGKFIIDEDRTFQGDSENYGDNIILKREASYSLDSVVVAFKYVSTIDYKSFLKLQKTKYYPDTLEFYFYTGIKIPQYNVIPDQSVAANKIYATIEYARGDWYNRNVFEYDYLPVFRSKTKVLQLIRSAEAVGETADIVKILPVNPIRLTSAGVPNVKYGHQTDVAIGVADSFIRTDATLQEPDHINAPIIKHYVKSGHARTVYKGEQIMVFGEYHLDEDLVLSDVVRPGETVPTGTDSKLVIL